MIMCAWRTFSSEHLASLGEQPAFIDDPGERCCPNCGGVLRQYLYTSSRSTGDVVVSYAWCSACRHYAGSTGPRPLGFSMADPLEALTSIERERIEKDLDGFFARLDTLWADGALPQDITF